MRLNIYEALMQKAYLFGALVLHSDKPIPREDVPLGWYCYDLRGTSRAPYSPYSLPEGVWMRLPWEDGLGDKTSIEEEVTLNALHAQSWAECALLDARCVLPEAGDLMEQYSDVEELIRDGLSLADALWWPLGEDTPWYPAALRLEHCQNLKLALDISRNPDCYRWLPRVDLEASAKEALTQAGVSEKITQSDGVSLRSYGAHLLEKQGYTLTADGGGYIARTAQEFHYSHSTLAPEQSGMVMQ